jgi:GNAT superfamily N-acetyltransferase
MIAALQLASIYTQGISKYLGELSGQSISIHEERMNIMHPSKNVHPGNDYKNQVRICSVPVSTIIPLRHCELRQGLPLETARFPGDNLPDSLHFALFYPVPENCDITDLVGCSPLVTSCASCVLNTYDGEPAWQLRGMATAKEHQGKGFGGLLLQVIETDPLIHAKTHRLWCNARKVAIPFYEKHGWMTTGEFFDIPLAGTHIIMTKEVQPC